MFRISDGETLDVLTLGEYINKFINIRLIKFKPLREAYMTDYPIFKKLTYDDLKPDKRIAVNFAKYITDTMNGFFIGIPVRVTSNDQAVTDYVDFLNAYNNQDDQNAELSKLCDIYGRGYEMYYVDEYGNIGITYLSPETSFMIYDDSILERPRYFVRLYIDANNVLRGSVSDESTVQWFSMEGGLHFYGEKKAHGFDGVPAVEYVDNAEKMGLYEPVMSMINEYNEVISEKANDVAYFADAYLKILGAMVDEKSLAQIKQNRIINFPGLMDNSQLVVDFLKRPDGDTTQEHLLDRLERLIFQISMVADISDENFGSTSGIALKYKLQAMSDLALTKQRKFTAGMQNRYKLIFSNPVSGMNSDAWTGLSYQFTQNIPANLLEEAQIAAQLTGIVSQPTQLKVLSIVDNIQDEIDRLKEEQDEVSYMTDYATNRTVEDVILE